MNSLLSKPKKKKEKIQGEEIKGATATEFGVFNVCVSGYDMTTVEHYAQYIHNLCHNLKINVKESYALPTKTTEIMLMEEHGTKMFVDAIVKTHERVIQVQEASAEASSVQRKPRKLRGEVHAAGGGLRRAERPYVLLTATPTHGTRKKATYDKFGEEDFYSADGSEVSTAFECLRGQKEKFQDPPIERDLHLGLEDLFYGCIKKIKISRRVMNEDGHTSSIRDKILTFIALTGFSVEVETLDGRLLNIPINEIVHPQYTKVVPGEGMPLANNPSTKGDLIISFITHFPEKLSPEKKQLLKQVFSSKLL
ncbi:hypothetical protein DNTS_026313 [Danionella cerebrum]|uniref:Small ribosomal subunit protein uS10 domain-containing protein n=1 Tax=Danionella cerebrum TaxID=2873325 RepID=A0A553RDX4_9TELE|nr:hypothetical protein DNTS_026313 [Danionella translucida]